jgi:hypothetical protein
MPEQALDSREKRRLSQQTKDTWNEFGKTMEHCRRGLHDLLSGSPDLSADCVVTMESGFPWPTGRPRLYLLTVDQAGAILVGATIILLAVPYIAIAFRYLKSSSMAAMLGLIFGIAFVGLESIERSIDFFIVGARCAHDFQTASGIEREIILNHLALRNEFVVGWTLQLRLSILLASCCFAVATWQERSRGTWCVLAPIAFSLNALRLLGRLLSAFAGLDWLNGLNGRFYFPGILVINFLLILWVLHLDQSPE